MAKETFIRKDGKHYIKVSLPVTMEMEKVLRISALLAKKSLPEYIVHVLEESLDKERTDTIMNMVDSLTGKER